MMTDKTKQTLELTQLPDLYKIARWDAKTAGTVAGQVAGRLAQRIVEALGTTGDSQRMDQQQMYSLSVTSTEVSLVFPAALEAEIGLEEASIEAPYTAFVVHGPLDFALVGILAVLTTALAKAAVSVFAVSTFDTDYILVKSDKAFVAAEAWKSVSDSFLIKVNVAQ
ncbi:hypothetical protein HK100_009488 [Physocladia obscura]|uniref:CASTOR ACT domain-containing protein n=1 Tax=Physocladia obscura TaxID=109957 RepID=A0AAD5T997_9FUNG|nr:hypothetical protein HK100_009488 [Physocladia obscura]